MNLVPGFISYSTTDKHVAGKVKSAFKRLGVDCFLAHDDINVSEIWKQRILEELKRCEVFVALLSTSFKTSPWTTQELGFAFAREKVLIIPIMLDTTIPFGFIDHLQGERLHQPVGWEQFLPLIGKRFPRYTIPRLVSDLKTAGSFRHAEALMKPMVPLFNDFADEEKDEFVDACTRNSQVWGAADCRDDYIPAFIELHRNRIDPVKLKALSYQIENGEWYPGEERD